VLILRHSPIFEFLASHRYIVIILVSGAVSYIFQKLNTRNMRRPAEKSEGWRYLKYGWACRSLAIVSGLFFGALLYMTYAVPNYATSPRGMLGARLIFGGFVALCLFMMYEYLIRTVRYNSAMVESRHPFGTKQIKIADIAHTNFHPGMGLIQLISGSGKRIWLPAVKGTEQFGRYLRRKQRLQALDDLRFENVGNFKEIVEWQSIISISESLKSREITDYELLEHGITSTIIAHGDAWEWKPEMGYNVKALLCSGEAYLCIRGHDFILEEGSAISIRKPVFEPFSIANVSGNDIRLLVADVAVTSSKTDVSL
jgi:hypothetical protein